MASITSIHLPRSRTAVLQRSYARFSDQLECTDPARSDFWELAGKCLRLARARG